MPEELRERVPTSKEVMPILSATPKKPDTGEMQNDLVRLGLSCEQASLQNLRQYVQDVTEQLPRNPHGLQSFLIGKRDTNLKTTLSRSALEFVVHAPRLSQHTLRERADALSSHPGCGDFLRHVLSDNLGGASFVSAMTGVERDDPNFFEQLSAEHPNTVQLLAILAQHDIVPSSSGTWVPDESQQYIGTLMDNLSELLNHDRFDCLRTKQEKSNKKDTHRGQQSDSLWGVCKYQQLDRFNWNSPTVQIIKNSYVGLAANATSFLDVGIETQNLVAILSNKIAGLQDSQLTDYDPGPQELLVFLVKNPVIEDGYPTVDGAGALSITWNLYVHEYKSKKKKYKEGWMDVWLRSALYESYSEFNGVMLQDQMNDDTGLCP
ncbi:hypothetical protein [Streptomyces zagrosensis]|uniref:Uncharacterized protein n=1 Tax=Streptomyces zagrosensis TaxID=1042984 RepID=A0A7W9V3W1_9ACTN|nr:hypothetical protein [Streptomyces zagrosensis]MBB5940349.1 hypothetical protein [Streptomyces zagrosensis]